MKNVTRKLLLLSLALAALLVFTACQQPAPAPTPTVDAETNPTVEATPEATAQGDDAQPNGGAEDTVLKTVTVQIVAADQNIDKSFTYEIDAKMLIDVIDANKEELGIELDDTGFITAAAGYAASSDNREFWGIYVNGEMGMFGASEQEVNDNDVFKLELGTY